MDLELNEMLESVLNKKNLRDYQQQVMLLLEIYIMTKLKKLMTITILN